MSNPVSSPKKDYSNIIPWVIGGILLLVLPFIFSDLGSLTIMNQIGITIVLAMSYNMLLGQGGMLSFGHAVYMGVGGFVAVHVMNFVENDGWPLPLPLLPLVGGLVGLGLATIVGSFSTRKAGTTFAMISLGIGELIAACCIIITVFFGGEEGISGDRTMGLSTFGVEFITQIEVYFLIAFWVFISIFLMYLFSQTPVGKMANAVRDNPERAEFVGYSMRWVRFFSFCGAGFFAGIAGALFAINFEILTEENLGLAMSFNVLLATYIGGVGFFIGPVVGAVVFTLLQTVVGLQTDLWALYTGVVFILIVMFLPAGLTGLFAMHMVPWQLGRFNMLLRPYSKIAIPIVLFVIGAVCLTELINHVRHHSEERMMTLFWVEFDTQATLPWVLIVAFLISGFTLSRVFMRELKEAWSNATFVEDGRR
ncbi:branched-chain amino acid ABC transporter permease [Paracoccaceae bacterium]|nr:branched-chain amino acid ABC transporter permease [Paracoccaceae bacterium]